MKFLPKNGNVVVTAIAPESPASLVCSIGDEILSANGYKLNNGGDLSRDCDRDRYSQRIKSI
jgi:S1-C subfamily serine protease